MKLKARHVFFLWMIVLVGSGSAAIYIGHKHEGTNLFPFVGAFGDALLIAGLLGLTVDPLLKKSLTSELLAGTLEKIYGKGLPQLVQDEIRTIAATNVVREDFRAEFIFRCIEVTNDMDDVRRRRQRRRSADHLYEVVSRVEFKATNIAQRNEWFEHVARVLERRGGRIARVRCYGLGSDDYDLREDIPITKQENGLEFRRKVLLRPGATASFLYETVRTLPASWDDVMYFVHPTVGIQLRITAPEELRVRVLYMRDGHLQTKPYHENELYLNEVVLLPNMSFVVSWRPKRDEHHLEGGGQDQSPGVLGIPQD